MLLFCVFIYRFICARVFKCILNYIDPPKYEKKFVSVHSDRGTLFYKTRTEALRNGDYGPRVRTPADRSRTSAGRTWASTCGSRTSSRPEPSEPAEGPEPCTLFGQGSGALTSPCGRGRRPQGPAPPRVPQGRPPLPARAGVRSHHVPLWARLPTPGSGAATCPTGTSLLPEASPPAALNAGGWDVRCQTRAWDGFCQTAQA